MFYGGKQQRGLTTSITKAPMLTFGKKLRFTTTETHYEALTQKVGLKKFSKC